jgi:hypothetical protein
MLGLGVDGCRSVYPLPIQGDVILSPENFPVEAFRYSPGTSAAAYVKLTNICLPGEAKVRVCGNHTPNFVFGRSVEMRD